MRWPIKHSSNLLINIEDDDDEDDEDDSDNGDFDDVDCHGVDDSEFDLMMVMMIPLLRMMMIQVLLCGR